MIYLHKIPIYVWLSLWFTMAKNRNCLARFIKNAPHVI